MGGSAIGGDLAAAALGERATRPLQTIRGYGLPSWATPEWSVLCCSYSGDTEETIACFAAAEALGARRLVASTGGAAHRAGARRRRAGGRPARDPPAAGRGRLHVRRRGRGGRPGRGRPPHPHRDRRRRRPPRVVPRGLQALAAEIAGRIEGSVPVIHGAGHHRPGGAPLEDPGQREREAPGLLHRAARGRPQRAGGLGRGRRARAPASPRSSSRTPTSTPASAAASS